VKLPIEYSQVATLVATLPSTQSSSPFVVVFEVLVPPNSNVLQLPPIHHSNYCPWTTGALSSSLV